MFYIMQWICIRNDEVILECNSTGSSDNKIGEGGVIHHLLTNEKKVISSPGFSILNYCSMYSRY